MDAKCPICGSHFPPEKIAAHLADDHKPSIDPEIAEAKAHAEHRCPFCQAPLPTPEALKGHIAQSHGK